MSLKEKKITFIGAGNMAEALVKGIVNEGLCPAWNITVTDVREAQREHFEVEYGVMSSADNAAAAKGADILVLAVKPQHFQEMLGDLKISENTLVISIAAGITTEGIKKALGARPRIVRVMPNTPALIGCGAAGFCGGAMATDEDMETAAKIFSAVGVAGRVEEDQMDAVTAVSGSGPAYVFLLIEAMEQAAAELGLEKALAHDLVLSTVEGAAELCRQSGVSAAELRERVTSKGGTTAAALDVLAKNGVRESIVEAMNAAAARADELAKA